jgi:hypothetical protein
LGTLAHALSLTEKRTMIKAQHDLSIRRQCELM